MQFSSVTRVIGLSVVLSLAASAQNFAWLEGENPTSANVPPNYPARGDKDMLSGGAWLGYEVVGDEVINVLPDEEEGLLIAYDFEAKAAGEHEVWARVAYEFERSPFDWRVDGAAWTRIPPTALTTDLMETAPGHQLGWLLLGKAQLAAGNHTLELRLPMTSGDYGKTQPLHFALDAMCVSLDPFFPHSRFKPGEDWQTEKDCEAAKHVFKFTSLFSVKLDGLWEVCRNDENNPPADIAQPMTDFPKEMRWTAIDVPSDKNVSRPDLAYAHRLWYRTRVEIPESWVGRTAELHFPQNSLNTTVFVNGQQCGFSPHPFTEFSVDITTALKPGVNEIMIGIRDAWYGFSTSPNNPMRLRGKFNLPAKTFSEPGQDLAFPIWGHPESGILQSPWLHVHSCQVYIKDFFVKPSFVKKEIVAEFTLTNVGKNPVNAMVRPEAILIQRGNFN
ncbi:MAG: hypothetical protein FWF96_00440, partial [Kiritimatiellaeota bacterium]|nr:hypothetical protein [Kiritimatiellota bacterium]